MGQGADLDLSYRWRATQKEMAFCTDDYQFYIRYTLLDAHSATTLRLKPFLAFRSVRQWTHETLLPTVDTQR